MISLSCDSCIFSKHKDSIGINGLSLSTLSHWLSELAAHWNRWGNLQNDWVLSLPGGDTNLIGLAGSLGTATSNISLGHSDTQQILRTNVSATPGITQHAFGVCVLASLLWLLGWWIYVPSNSVNRWALKQAPKCGFPIQLQPHF